MYRRCNATVTVCLSFAKHHVSVMIHSPLGISLGEDDGNEVGTSDGWSEGLKDGIPLGTDDGRELGVSEGTSVVHPLKKKYQS